jgi:hypothetical protein
LHQPRSRYACTAGNCRTGHSSRAWPEGALRTDSCNNATQPRQPNGPKIAGPMRAKSRLGNQTRPWWSCSVYLCRSQQRKTHIQIIQIRVQLPLYRKLQRTWK